MSHLSSIVCADREQRELYEAAKIIQKAYRSYKGRKKLEEQDKERAAAILIQNYYRRYKQVSWTRPCSNLTAYRLHLLAAMDDSFYAKLINLPMGILFLKLGLALVDVTAGKEKMQIVGFIKFYANLYTFNLKLQIRYQNYISPIFIYL